MTSRSLLLVALAWWIGLMAGSTLPRFGFDPMQLDDVHWTLSSIASGIVVGVFAMTVATRIVRVEAATWPGVLAGFCFVVTGLGIDVHLRLTDPMMIMPPIMTVYGFGAALGYSLAAMVRDYFTGRSKLRL